MNLSKKQGSVEQKIVRPNPNSLNIIIKYKEQFENIDNIEYRKSLIENSSRFSKPWLKSIKNLTPFHSINPSSRIIQKEKNGVQLFDNRNEAFFSGLLICKNVIC